MESSVKKSNLRHHIDTTNFFFYNNLMKKFLAFLICHFLLINPSNADEIRNFQIGNFSLNESLLDNFTKEELISNAEYQQQTYSFKNNKYYKIALFDKKYKPYDSIILYTLRSDKLFKIKSITGVRSSMDTEKCRKELISISDEFTRLFPSASKKKYGPVKKLVDPTGKSLENGIYFVFNNGDEAGVSCIDYGKEYLKKHSYASDHMQIFLDTKKYASWLQKEAWQ